MLSYALAIAATTLAVTTDPTIEAEVTKVERHEWAGAVVVNIPASTPTACVYAGRGRGKCFKQLNPQRELTETHWAIHFL